MIEKLLEKLPGLDCGACGSPTCRALAEDIVRGKAEEIDCPLCYEISCSAYPRRFMP